MRYCFEKAFNEIYKSDLNTLFYRKYLNILSEIYLKKYKLVYL